MRHASRSSSSAEKCSNRRAKRARGLSSSRVVSILVLPPNQCTEGITDPPSTQNQPIPAVNPTSQPCSSLPVGFTPDTSVPIREAGRIQALELSLHGLPQIAVPSAFAVRHGSAQLVGGRPAERRRHAGEH